MAAVQNKKPAPPKTPVTPVQNKKVAPPKMPAMKSGGMMKGGKKC